MVVRGRRTLVGPPVSPSDAATRPLERRAGFGSTQVLNSAQMLATESSRLKKEVDKFLIAVRAA